MMEADATDENSAISRPNVAAFRSPKLRGLSRRNVPGVSTFCSAPACTNTRGKDKLLGVKRSYHRFPLKDTERMKKWMDSIPRAAWVPQSSEAICSDHFVGGMCTHDLLFTLTVIL
jgi:hypothetical protein